MMAKHDVGGFFERPHRDGYARLMDRIPKEKRSATLAETTPYFFGGGIPGQFVFALDSDLIGWHVGGHPIMPRLLPALRTVTSIGRGQIALYLKSHRAAKTGTFMHFYRDRIEIITA